MYFHIRRSGGGGLGPKICLWNSCWSPKFCLQKFRWQIPQILSSEFQIWPQNWDFPPTFASCNNRTSQAFPLIWWTCPKFCLQTWCEVQAPATSWYGSTPSGFLLIWYKDWKRYVYPETQKNWLKWTAKLLQQRNEGLSKSFPWNCWTEINWQIPYQITVIGRHNFTTWFFKSSEFVHSSVLR